MTGVAFMRLKKLTGNGVILKAAKHNKRSIPAEIQRIGSIDVARSPLNFSLVGPPTPEDVSNLAKKKLEGVGISKTRRDAVLGLEFVFSLPRDHQVNVHQYFSACAEWAGHNFGGAENLISVDIHLDEAQDHAHVLLVPLIDGRLRGSDAVGNKRKLSSLQASFYEAVAQPYGFSRPPKRLYGSVKRTVANQVIEKLRSDSAVKSIVWPQIRMQIEADPAPFAEAFGISIEVERRPMRTMTQIFTSKGKGPLREHSSSQRDLNPTRASLSKRPRPLGLCRSSSQPLNEHAKDAPTANSATLDQTFIRSRESEMPSALWDEEKGEFIQPI